MSIVIKAKRDGFRRCGIAHPGRPTKYADDFFTEEQLKALIKEPQLILAYEDDEFDQEQGGPNEDFSQSSIPQAPDTAPGSQPQAPETVITSVAAPVVSTVAAVLVDGGPGATSGAPVLGGTNDDAARPLSGQAPDAALAPVVGVSEPANGDASVPAAKAEPAEAKPEKTRTAKVKDATK